MASETADTIVIGAGVIGLAIARELAQIGREVLVLESNSSFGMETSSRNSGVIHAGIYYQPGSLKARCCIDGKQMLYDYCRDRHIPFNPCGKLIIASSKDQRDQLKALQHNARRSGLGDIEWLGQDQVFELEPDVKASAGLYSPSTGIIGVHELMLAFVTDLEAAGGVLVTHNRVLSINVDSGGFELRIENGGEYTFNATTVINAAGHGAANIARRITGFPASHIPVIHPVRGHYYEHAGKLPFSRLVYPLPKKTSLGVHLTIDLAGQVRFGPDAEYCETIDYRFDESRRPRFVDAIRDWYPGLDESRLQPGYVGIRPNLRGPGDEPADFIISGPGEHGVKGLINLFGIDSPGLTSCLSLAKVVAQKSGPGEERHG
jgi:L-2-hydroxyglutarate oxidase LhgO